MIHSLGFVVLAQLTLCFYPFLPKGLQGVSKDLKFIGISTTAKMGFNAVYETLKEIFPQLDARVLQSVAIEHSKDVHAAINDVLVEVIPYLDDKIISPSTAPNDSSPGVVLDKGDGKDKESKISNHDRDVIRADLGPPEQNIISFDGSYNNSYVPNSVKAPPSGTMDESQSELVNFYDASDGDDHYTSVAPNIKSQEYSGEVINYTPHAKSNDVLPENGEIDDIKIEAEQLIALVDMTNLVRENGIDGIPNEEHTSLSSAAVDDSDAITHERIHEVEPCVHRVYQYADLMSPAPVSREFDSEKSLNGSTDLTSKLDYSVMSNTDKSFVEQLICDSLVTQSDKSCNVDFLEEMIEAAKNNKKTLFSAMETVSNEMKEVEIREKALEQAQIEAANGGVKIMLMVEELKHLLVRAKEANNMHAGEVYGEKAILVTEARELQSRLINLSDERNKYLQILDEMRHSIEIRLASAEGMISNAKQEKMRKEVDARISLAEQEALMEKIVMESMILQQEAEQNSKLQEFLVNRSRIVDTLQGEISVICQDVKLMKKKFDDRVPLSKYLFSSQTSYILASSPSKSAISHPVNSDWTTKEAASPDSCAARDGSFHNLEKRSPCSSVDGDSCAAQDGSFHNLEKRNPRSPIDGSPLDHRIGLEKTRTEDKALLEDGWDLLDEVSDLDD